MPKRKKSSVLKRSLSSPNTNASAVVKKNKRRRKRAGDFTDTIDTHKYLAQEKKKSGTPPSLPVLEEHRQASWAVARLLESDAQSRNGASIKSLTLASHISNKKAVYAITVETLKALPQLERLIQQAGLVPQDQGEGSDHNATLAKAVTLVLVREMLWGRGLHHRQAGPAERRVLDAKDMLAGLSSAHPCSGPQAHREDLLRAASRRPRTARVNTLKLSLQEAQDRLKGHVSKFVCDRVSVDPHLPDVLVFPPDTDLHDHPLVTNGSLILQSKASCIPAHVLSPNPGWTVLDACAAPGNKTTHLASLMQGRGKIIACDKDPKRLRRLEKNVAMTGTESIIEPRCMDFLSVDPSTPVDAILLDPSCSGSGTFLSRMDFLLPSASQKESWNLETAAAYSDDRIRSLASFQRTALQHALSFTSVQRIVYSTCSVYIEENEGVVASVLEEAAGLGFTLKHAIPSCWDRRGFASKSLGLNSVDASKLLRTDPLEDATDGFFVALFQRTA